MKFQSQREDHATHAIQEMKANFSRNNIKNPHMQHIAAKTKNPQNEECEKATYRAFDIEENFSQ
jgi:hypothetical protein